MAYNLLLIDDEAPEVIDHLLKPYSEDQECEINHLSKVADIPWGLVDSATIILVDYYFPDDHTGIEFLRALRKERPFLLIPLVLLSAPKDIRETEWQECLELGVKDFICKSTPPQIVKRKIDSLVEGEVYRRMSEELKEKLYLKEEKSAVESLNFTTISSLVPDANEWAYIFRIILKEGPLHRRHANGILLAILNELLSQLATRMGKKIEPYPYETIKGDLQESAPPSTNLSQDRTAPLGIPSRLLNEIFQRDQEKIAEAVRNLLTGPPHEVFMSILLLHIYESFHHIIGSST